MKSGMLTVSLVLLAGHAQGAMFWSMKVKYSNPAGSIREPGDTATVRLWAHFDEGLYAFSTGMFDVTVDDHADAGVWTDFGCDLADPGFQDGVADEGTVNGIVTTQDHAPLGNIFADTSNPILVWHGTFTTTDFSIRPSFKIFTETSGYDVYTDFDGNSEDFGGSVAELNGRINFGIPSPGSGVWVVAALVGGSRRRRQA